MSVYDPRDAAFWSLFLTLRPVEVAWMVSVKIHAELGGNKTFTCPRCEIVLDRDVAGARNNFLAAYGKAVGVGWDGASG